jgi:hypothetical protein
MAVKEREATDFRSDRMPSAEGQGKAKGNLRRAWDAYERAVKSVATPFVRPLAEKLTGPVVVDMVGFWLTWHLEGGFEGLQRLGMSRASIYRRVALFRKFMGAHPDDFEFPGVTIDLDAYLRSSAMSIADRETHPKRGARTTAG